MCETTHGLRMCPPRHPWPPAARRRAPTPAVGPEKNVDAVQMPFRANSRVALKVDFGRRLAALEVVFELLYITPSGLKSTRADPRRYLQRGRTTCQEHKFGAS